MGPVSPLCAGLRRRPLLRGLLAAALCWLALAAPAAAVEPFAELTFKARLDVARTQGAKDSLTLNGSFRLGVGSNGADPAREEVELRVGRFHVVLPPGSFARDDGGGEEGTLWVHNGHLNGLTHLALLQDGAAWAVQAGAHKVDLSGTANPIIVALRIGDDAAARSRYFGIFPAPQKVVFRFPPGADRDADDDGALRDADDCDDQAPAVHPGAEERCNGIDDDCDAEADEGFILGGACSAGVGACERSGVTVCSPDGGGTVCGATPGEPQPETCDGRDDDCDGVSDDGFDVGAACTVGIGACARSGAKVCTPDAAGTTCDAIPGPPAAETCNGLDDDCDGAADEELGELRCGVGLCARAAPACLAGVPQLCAPGEPAAEICGNGVDEDCDGEDLACPALALAIVEPASLATVNRSPVTVAGTTSDEAAEVECAGVPAALTAAGDGRRFEASVPLREGRNTVTCRGLDACGSVGTATVVVTLDGTPPVIVVETPRDGLVTFEPAVTVAGSFNDAIAGAFDSTAVAVSCNGLPAAVEHRAFVVRGLPLRPGANAIRCTATDPAGNEAETPARSVTRLDLAGQRIERLAGDGQSGEVGALLPQPLAVRLVDAAGLPVAGRTVTFRVSCGSGVLGDGASEERQLGVATDAAGRAAAPAPATTASPRPRSASPARSSSRPPPGAARPSASSPSAASRSAAPPARRCRCRSSRWWWTPRATRSRAYRSASRWRAAAARSTGRRRPRSRPAPTAAPPSLSRPGPTTGSTTTSSRRASPASPGCPPSSPPAGSPPAAPRTPASPASCSTTPTCRSPARRCASRARRSRPRPTSRASSASTACRWARWCCASRATPGRGRRPSRRSSSR
jgi:hypothetical protein